MSGLPHIAPDIPVLGLSSEFAVKVILKGDSGLKSLVVHHYRLAKPDAVMMNAPDLIAFDPSKEARYMLFLKREPDGRYAPLDQVDPAWTSIFQLKDPAWDKMNSDDFKKWMECQTVAELARFRECDRDAAFAGNPPGGEGAGSLHEAALNGKLDKANALIKDHPNLVFDQNSYGQLSPLQIAAEYGQKQVAELLLANKADIEAKSYGNWTPLLDAVFGGHKALVALLLDHQANVNWADNWGRTPLHVAAENSYTDIAALLLEHKAAVNALNSDGMTPLHLAAVQGSKELVSLLLAYKADTTIKAKNGETPFDTAVRSGHQDVADLLRIRF